MDDMLPPAGEQKDRSLELLLADLRDMLHQEQAAAAHWRQLESQRQQLETQIAAKVRALLGADAAANIGRALGNAPAHPSAPPPTPGIDFGAPFGPPPPAPPPPTPPPPHMEIRGVNYYPSREGWWRMWYSWDPAEVYQELALAKSLGATHIRTFLPYSQIEGLLPEGAPADYVIPEAATILDRVESYLAIACMHGLQTILGLFDEARLLRDGLATDQAAAVAHVAHVLDYVSPHTSLRFGDDPRIAMWDLVNELDDYWAKSVPRPDRPGDNAHLLPLFMQPVDSTDPLQRLFPTPESNPIFPFTQVGLDWLNAVVGATLQKAGPTQRVTLSVTNPSSLPYLLRRFAGPRFVPQYHEYLRYGGDINAYKAKIADNMNVVAQKFGPGQRVLIGEVGMPSQLHLQGQSFDYTEALQSQLLQTVLETAQKNADKLLGVLVWTLTDWNYDDSPLSDPEHWRGLFKLDPNDPAKKRLVPKAAASIAKQLFHTIA